MIPLLSKLFDLHPKMVSVVGRERTFPDFLFQRLKIVEAGDRI
jgi:hypothetical protein